MSVPGGSMCIFPASSIPRAAKTALTFAETQFGPEPQPPMELLAERGLAPVVICESAAPKSRRRLHHAADVPCSAGFEKIL